jgi:ATP phosphoribosyltransferase regulatory subunit
LQGQSAELQRCCYAGPAFRRLREPAAKATQIADGEFHQAGIEVYGGEGAKTDAEVLGLCMEGVHGQGLERLEVRLGHPGLFAKLIEALDLPDGWRRRLRRHFVRQDVIDDLRQASDSDAGVARAALGEALSGLETASAVDLIEEVLALGGIEPVGGRTAEEIAARFMKRAAESAAAPSQETIALLDAYLKVKGPPDAALPKIGDLCAAAGLDAAALLGELRGLCDSAGEVADRLGLGRSAVTFDAEFGRRLEYYTGFVFEIHDPGNTALRQIAGGGRYDRLLGDLGASEPLPAVGCAVYVDRLLAATGRGA